MSEDENIDEIQGLAKRWATARDPADVMDFPRHLAGNPPAERADLDTLGDDGQHYVVGGLAWSLCEWAGWPA